MTGGTHALPSSIASNRFVLVKPGHLPRSLPNLENNNPILSTLKLVVDLKLEFEEKEEEPMYLGLQVGTQLWPFWLLYALNLCNNV